MISAHTSGAPHPELQNLAEFRYVLRKFLHFSEEAATREGLTHQQHQLLLQIAGAPHGAVATIGYLADRMALRHHSVVELSSRCEDAGLVHRIRGNDSSDQRLVMLKLTTAGTKILRALSRDHSRELNELAPRLIKTLRTFTG